MDQKKIDRLFREKLDHLEVTPSANAWSQVEGRIRPRKKPVIYWVAASVSLIALTWVAWNVQDQDTYTPIASEVSYPPFQRDAFSLELPVSNASNGNKQNSLVTKRRLLKPTRKVQPYIKQKQGALVAKSDESDDSNTRTKSTTIRAKSGVVAVANETSDLPLKIVPGAEKTVYQPIKITYIASAGQQSTEVQKADSTGGLKKFIALAEKIDPGDILADFKTAKDHLFNGGLKSKRSKNAL